jgi:hypothetical protein
VRTKIPQNPTTGPVRGLPPCSGEGPPRSPQPDPRRRSRAPGQPRRRQAVDRAGARHHGLPSAEGQDRWRAVWYENGNRRQSEKRLADRLEKVTERLAADAPNMERTGADLIAHYLDPDRLPTDQRWSLKHAHTQRRLCERFAIPVIGDVPCQDIKTWHMQQVVNAAPTAHEGAQVHGMISPLVGAGLEGGYLANPRLAKVHWQAAGRPLPAPRVSVARGNQDCGSIHPVRR